MFEVDKIQYTLDFRIIDGDVGLPQNSFRTSDFLPHGKQMFALLYIFKWIANGIVTKS